MYNLQINVLSKNELLRVWISLFSDDKKKNDLGRSDCFQNSFSPTNLVYYGSVMYQL